MGLSSDHNKVLHMLSCYVQNFVAITLLETRWKQKKIHQMNPLRTRIMTTKGIKNAYTFHDFFRCTVICFQQRLSIEWNCSVWDILKKFQVTVKNWTWNRRINVRIFYHLKIKLWVAHAPRMPWTFSPPPRLSDPDMHHGTCVTHVPWCGISLTSGFLWIRWRRKRSRHSRRMRNPQFCVSGKRPML